MHFRNYMACLSIKLKWSTVIYFAFHNNNEWICTEDKCNMIIVYMIESNGYIRMKRFKNRYVGKPVPVKSYRYVYRFYGMSKKERKKEKKRL